MLRPFEELIVRVHDSVLGEHIAMAAVCLGAILIALLLGEKEAQRAAVMESPANPGLT